MDYLIYKGKCTGTDMCCFKLSNPCTDKMKCHLVYTANKKILCLTNSSGYYYNPISTDLLTLITAREKKERFRSFLKSLLKKRLLIK